VGVDTIAAILAMPTISMMLGSLLVFRFTINPKVISALQHFASGILVGAVGWELVPEIEAATTGEMFALGVGFILGASFLLFVGRYDFAHWRKRLRCYKKMGFEALPLSTEETDDNNSTNQQTTAKASLEDLESQVSPSTDDTSVNQLSPDLESSQIISVTDETDTKPKIEVLTKKTEGKHVPLGLIFAVLVDGSIDGLLIGICSLASEGAGLVTAIALAVEMALLGISTCNTLRKCNISLLGVLVLCLSLPLAIMISGLLGSMFLLGVDGVTQIAVLAFGGAGLLYLVTEELMIEAHEDEENDRWWVSAMFFVGFLFVVMLDKLLPEYI